MQDFHIDVNQLIHLKDAKDIKVLMDVEQFYFVKWTWVSDAEDNKFHNLRTDVTRRKVSQVNLHSDLESIVFDACHEQIYKVLVLDISNVCS